ncbi:MAG TPA: hypothetical protein VJU61_07305, partial [Polyangiaceae bacterium]|nr:hypothetical protein [Polyangiaceae bacterium]
GEPEVLVEHPFESRNVQVGGGFLLWNHVPLTTKESFIRILDLASGERPGLTDPFTPLVSVKDYVLPFTLRGSEVFWFDTETTALVQTPVAGGQSTSTPIAGLLEGARVDSLMVDGACIYWHAEAVVRGNGLAYHLGKLCDGMAEPTAAMAAPATEAMAVRDGTLYGAGDNDPSSTAYVARVHRWASPQFEPERLAAGLDFAEAIAVDEENLYFLDGSFDELRLHRIQR